MERLSSLGRSDMRIFLDQIMSFSVIFTDTLEVKKLSLSQFLNTGDGVFAENTPVIKPVQYASSQSYFFEQK